MTGEQLTAILAKRFMGWGVGPDRFLLGERRWIRRTQFEPVNRIQDAFRLLHAAAARFSLTKSPTGVFTATVQVGDQTCTASGPTVAATITRAIALAVGLDLEEGR